MVFSENAKEEVKEEVMAVWGYRGAAQYEKYLGLPPIIGRSRKRAFSNIKMKLWQQSQTYK